MSMTINESRVLCTRSALFLSEYSAVLHVSTSLFFLLVPQRFSSSYGDSEPSDCAVAVVGRWAARRQEDRIDKMFVVVGDGGGDAGSFALEANRIESSTAVLPFVVTMTLSEMRT